MHFRDMDAIQILKDYMASGSFARGRDMINADASMVYVGNINDSVDSLLKVTHLFTPFPPEFNSDSAFLIVFITIFPVGKLQKCVQSCLLKNMV